jgi:hypothetical protein
MIAFTYYIDILIIDHILSPVVTLYFSMVDRLG